MRLKVQAIHYFIAYSGNFLFEVRLVYFLYLLRFLLRLPTMIETRGCVNLYLPQSLSPHLSYFLPAQGI